MARLKKMTLDEYIKNRDDLTHVSVIANIVHVAAEQRDRVQYAVAIVVDETYYDRDAAEAMADHISKTLGINRW